MSQYRMGAFIGGTIAAVAAAGIFNSLSVMDIQDRLDKLEQVPTYHCDGSLAMGYAEPGTPEASACWFEGPKEK